MTNLVFNQLGKCGETYFVDMSEQVLHNNISIKNLVENYQTFLSIEKVYSLLSQLAGFKSKTQLMTLYPGKFEPDRMKLYIGADYIGEELNDQAALLNDYWIKVVKGDSEIYEVIDPVKFVEIVNIKDLETSATPLDPFDMMIVNFKDAQPDFCLELINKLIRSDKIMHAALMIFESESQQFENLSCLRSNSFGDMERFKIVPVYFNKFKQKLGEKGMFLENMSFGILFGRFSVLSPPLKRAYRNLDNLTEIVASVCPPEAKVAMVADTGIPLIKIHTSELSYQVAYFGSKEHFQVPEKAEQGQNQFFTQQLPPQKHGHRARICQ